MQNFLFIKADGFYCQLKFSDIFYIEAEKKYILIATSNKLYHSLASISHIEKLLPKDSFFRIHRSYIISLEHLCKFDNDLAYVGNKKLPIAKQFKEPLKEAITLVNCEIKALEPAKLICI